MAATTFAADDQQAVLDAVDELLDDDIRALGLGQREGGLDVGLLRQLQRHAARVVAVGRLDGDGEADVLRHLPGLSALWHDLASGTGTPQAASRRW